jgi:hypothetical protein
MKRFLLLIVLLVALATAPVGAQLRAGVFTTVQTTSTTVNSLLIGCALGSTTCTGGIKAGQISLASGMAISGATISTAGIVIGSAVPALLTNALYNDAGTLKWNGVALATGSSVSGTTNTIAVFTSSTALGDSIITQSGSTATVTGTLNATTAFNLAGASINTTGTLTNVAYKAQNNSFTVAQTFAAGISLSGGTPSTHGLMLPSGTPAVTTTNLYNASDILTWTGGLSLNTSANSALVTMALRGGGAAGAYTLANSGVVFKNGAGTEQWRIWGTDPSAANFNAANLYVGFEAGLNQPTDNVSAGTFNNGFGWKALRAISTGDANVAVGDSTLMVLTTGSLNVAIGAEALTTLISGLGNVAVGSGALQDINDDSYNVAVGGNALTALTAGTENVAVGQDALWVLTSGNNNIALGERAGALYGSGGGTALTEATQSILIGSEARASANSNTNEIVIGYAAIGAGTNTARIGNTSVTQAYLPLAIFQGTRTTAMGEWADQTFAAGDYTADGGATWTVDSGDVILNRYTIVGKTVTWQFTITGTDVTGATPTQLRVALPTGLTQSNHVRWGSCGSSKDAAAHVFAVWSQTNVGYVYLNKYDATNWSTTSSDNTNVACTVVFEIT